MPCSLSRSLAVISMAFLISCTSSRAAVKVPDPAKDAPLSKTSGSATVVLAGGCFWGIQAVFEHVKV